MKKVSDSTNYLSILAYICLCVATSKLSQSCESDNEMIMIQKKHADQQTSKGEIKMKQNELTRLEYPSRIEIVSAKFWIWVKARVKNHDLKESKIIS